MAPTRGNGSGASPCRCCARRCSSSWLTGIVSTAQVFDTVYALTGGGPAGSTELVAHRIYAEAFGSAAIGRAPVMAVMLFVILIGVTFVQHLYFRKRSTYDIL